MDDRSNDAKESSYSVLVFQGRPPEQYMNMIYGRWKRSLREGNEYFKLSDPISFNEAYTNYIDSILNRKSTTVRIAVLSDDHDVALGWSCSENSTLHYVHVSHDHRKMGIARGLVPGEVKTITHLTKIGMNIWHKKIPLAVFNPFA